MMMSAITWTVIEFQRCIAVLPVRLLFWRCERMLPADGMLAARKRDLGTSRSGQLVGLSYSAAVRMGKGVSPANGNPPLFESHVVRGPRLGRVTTCGPGTTHPDRRRHAGRQGPAG